MHLDKQSLSMRKTMYPIPWRPETVMEPNPSINGYLDAKVVDGLNIKRFDLIPMCAYAVNAEMA